MNGSPNIIAYLALALWPVVVWLLYRRLDAGRALIWTVLGGYLLLPGLVKFDLPLVPDLDKDTLPGLSAALVTFFMLGRRLSFLPQGWAGRVLVGLFILTPFATTLTNTDPIAFASAPPLPGMRIYDSLSFVANQALALLPFFLARRDLATPEAMRDLLAILVGALIVYSLPMLVEVGIGPQFNIWIYGYFQHSLEQQVRFGGFRPVVFLPHGLWMAMLAMLAFLASAAFLRAGPAARRPLQLVVLLWLGIVLILCKSFGPLAYAICGLPLILLVPGRVQILAAALAGAVVMSYPLLRGAHLVPLDEIVDFTKGLDEDRAWSLEYRIINEEALLDRANERPLFGWGGYGRSLVRDEEGRATTLTDGMWVYQIGSYGWLGYIALFGLLVLPLWSLLRESAAGGPPVTPPVAAVAVLFALNLVDLLPNATLVPFTWLMGGALLGHVERLRRARAGAEKPARPGPGATGAERTVI